MLKPAMLYKDELEKKFAEVMYDDDYFLYMGYAHGHELPKIEPRDNVYQWAIVKEQPIDTKPDPTFITPFSGSWTLASTHISYNSVIKHEVIGYFAYQIQPETDTVLNFGLYSFDRGNPIIGKDIFTKMKELVEKYRRLEWRVIGGNPVIRHYDKFCYLNGGKRVTLHNVAKDPNGTYRDEHIYEIVRD